MSDHAQIVSLVKGAEIYRRHGLYAEAREKYLEALSLLSAQSDMPNQVAVKEMVEKRIRLVNEGIAEAARPEEPPELSPSVQDLIKHLFSGKNEGAVFEGAVALMKFGQYKRAIEEFERLMAEGIQPLVAARNIVNCSLLTGSPPEDTVERFRRWGEKKLLTERELLYMQDFFQSKLMERGIDTKLNFPLKRSAGERHERDEDETDPEISTMTIDFEDGRLKGRSEELKVSFQFGNVLSILVPSSQKTLIQALAPGAKLYSMGFYSPIAFFRGKGKITARSLIKQGPNKGDYLIDITIDER